MTWISVGVGPLLIPALCSVTGSGQQRAVTEACFPPNEPMRRPLRQTDGLIRESGDAVLVRQPHGSQCGSTSSRNGGKQQNTNFPSCGSNVTCPLPCVSGKGKQETWQWPCRSAWTIHLWDWVQNLAGQTSLSCRKCTTRGTGWLWRSCCPGVLLTFWTSLRERGSPTFFRMMRSSGSGAPPCRRGVRPSTERKRRWSSRSAAPWTAPPSLISQRCRTWSRRCWRSDGPPSPRAPTGEWHGPWRTSSPATGNAFTAARRLQGAWLKVPERYTHTHTHLLTFTPALRKRYPVRSSDLF